MSRGNEIAREIFRLLPVRMPRRAGGIEKSLMRFPCLHGENVF